MPIFSQDMYPSEFVRNIVTPQPCNDGGNSWNGPYWYKICSDTVANLSGQNLYTCCYWVKYYDRTTSNSSGTVKSYETNVVGIFYEGNDCEKRTKETIIQEFQESLYQKLCLEDESYFNKVQFPYTWYQAHVDTYVYSTGGCFQKDTNGNIIYDSDNKPLPCNEYKYCCRQTKGLHLTRDESDILHVQSLGMNPINQSDPYFEVISQSGGPSCPNSCKEGCNNVMMQGSIDIDCDTPCNDGPWESKEKLIPMPTCPSCTVKVEYYTRTIICPEYGNVDANDIYLDKIEVNDDPTGPCAICNLSAQQIHEVVFNDLKNYEFPNPPTQPGQCKEYFRFFQSSCWRDELIPGHWDFESEPPYNPVWIPPYRLIMKCAGNNCCKRVFRICRTQQGILLPPVQVGPSESQELDCGINPEECFFICN